jgi:hypothetical protein
MNDTDCGISYCSTLKLWDYSKAKVFTLNNSLFCM